MSNERSLRLFVAIELPDAWLEALGQLQERMRRAIEANRQTRGLRLRWVRPEGIHLTLKFLGPVQPGRLDAVLSRLEGAVPESPAIELTLARPGVFEGRRAPRVLWCAVETPQLRRLQQLAGVIDAALEPEGIERERRPFAPHLTLARLPDDLSEDQKRDAARVALTVTPPAVAPFRATRVSLIRSHLGPGGARYERLATIPGDA